MAIENKSQAPAAPTLHCSAKNLFPGTQVPVGRSRYWAGRFAAMTVTGVSR
jgi:hypothetical protein